jgi:hypothetical protein
MQNILSQITDSHEIRWVSFLMKNSLDTHTLVPLLVDARETLEPPAST